MRVNDEITDSDAPRAPEHAGRRTNGLLVVLVATAVAGALGYLIQAVAGFGLTPAAYAGFGIFWTAMASRAGAPPRYSRAFRFPRSRCS